MILRIWYKSYVVFPIHGVLYTHTCIHINAYVHVRSVLPYSVPAEGEVRGAARVRGLRLDGAAATATAAAAAAAVVQQCVVYSFVIQIQLYRDFRDLRGVCTNPL